MTYPTYAVSTELDAVNQILSSVGQAPVTTLDLQNPEVGIVLNTLREVNKLVQSEGWVFNTERHYKLTADSVTFEIEYPDNALSIDTHRHTHMDDYNPVRRNGKLYEAYITARAARLCAVRMVGDQTLYALLEAEELSARAAAIEHETQQGDLSIFGWQDEEDYHHSYQPFKALRR